MNMCTRQLGLGVRPTPVGALDSQRDISRLVRSSTMILETSQEIFHPRPTGVSSYFRRLWRAAKAHRESFVDANFGRRRTETHQQIACIFVLNILDPIRKAIRA